MIVNLFNLAQLSVVNNAENKGGYITFINCKQYAPNIPDLLQQSPSIETKQKLEPELEQKLEQKPETDTFISKISNTITQRHKQQLKDLEVLSKFLEILRSKRYSEFTAEMVENVSRFLSYNNVELGQLTIPEQFIIAGLTGFRNSVHTDVYNLLYSDSKCIMADLIGLNRELLYQIGGTNTHVLLDNMPTVDKYVMYCLLRLGKIPPKMKEITIESLDLEIAESFFAFLSKNDLISPV